MRGLVKDFTLFGQNQTAGMTVEKRCVDAFLKVADLSANGGLAQIQRLAGMGKASGFGDGVKNSEFVPVHRNAFGVALERAISLSAKSGLGWPVVI